MYVDQRTKCISETQIYQHIHTNRSVYVCMYERENAIELWFEYYVVVVVWLLFKRKLLLVYQPASNSQRVSEWMSEWMHPSAALKTLNCNLFFCTQTHKRVCTCIYATWVVEVHKEQHKYWRQSGDLHRYTFKGITKTIDNDKILIYSCGIINS